MGNTFLSGVNLWKHDCAAASPGYQSIRFLLELAPGLLIDDFTVDNDLFNCREKTQYTLWSGNAKNMDCRSKWHIVCSLFATSAQGVCRRVNLLRC